MHNLSFYKRAGLKNAYCHSKRNSTLKSKTIRQLWSKLSYQNFCLPIFYIEKVQYQKLDITSFSKSLSKF